MAVDRRAQGAGGGKGRRRTAEEVIEERRGAALGEEVARELRDPGDNVDDCCSLEATGRVRERRSSERREHQLRDVEQLWTRA